MKRSSHPYCVLGGCSFLRFDEKIEIMGSNYKGGVVLSDT
jgi:hypothetical protein